MKRLRINKIFLILLCLSIAHPQVDAGEELNMDRPFGVLEFLSWNHSWNNYKYSDKESLHKVVALMKEAGVGIVRMDFYWQDIEPREDEFQFEKYDYIVDLLFKKGIQVLGLLHYSADWASSNGQWNYPPKDNKLFVNYAVKVVKRYKDKVKYWEIWNEPDSHIYWVTQDGLKSYCRLLKDTYSALKEIDPECKILNGGLANGIVSINRLYDNGAKDYFDILNIHIFVSPLKPNAIKEVTAYPKAAYKIMKRNADTDKKIWITEIGAPGVKNDVKTQNWWLGSNPSEKQQVDWIEKVFTELPHTESVEKIFWAFFRDCNNHWRNGTDYFGLVRWDFSKKPSFFTYKKCFINWKKNN